MFPFWKVAVLPVLRSVGAKRVVEIGALRGENTDLMLRDLDEDVELHVIDPAPEFDPTVHEREWSGRYVFHRALSLDVLSGLPPMDAAIIDGDHNWYTVHNELRQLTDVATAAGKPMPLMILHDVGWPYGRRDLYYAPETIPAEFRQPWRRAGMLPGKSELVDSGGLNPDMANATSEGGERNGVMTAVDDFVAAHPKPIRVVVLPVYFGLAILVEEDVLTHSAKLRWHFDRLEGEQGKDQLMKLAEHAHLKAMIYQHAALQRADDRHARVATRYLHAVAGSIGADDAGNWCRALVEAGAGDVVLADVDDAACITLALAHVVATDRDEVVRLVGASDAAVAAATEMSAGLGLDAGRLVRGVDDADVVGLVGTGTTDNDVVRRLDASGVPVVRFGGDPAP